MSSEKNINDLGHLTQIRKVLLKLKHKKRIRGFGRVENIAFNGLIYRIYFDDRRKFDIRIQFAKTFTPNGGAEIGNTQGWEVVLLIGPGVTIQRITSLLNLEIAGREKGIILERQFQKHLEKLLELYPDFNDVVSYVSLPTEEEDMSLKIDRFIVLSTGKKIPIQIKGSLSGRAVHKSSGSNIPSIVYSKNMDNMVLLEKILQICSSFQNGLVEHL